MYLEIYSTLFYLKVAVCFAIFIIFLRNRVNHCKGVNIVYVTLFCILSLLNDKLIVLLITSVWYTKYVLLFAPRYRARTSLYMTLTGLIPSHIFKR